MTIVFKLHESGRELLLAACDKNLLNRTLKSVEGAEVFISSDFYNGEEVDEKGLIKLVKKATIVNLFGEETIQAVINAGLCNESNVLRFENVPHAQIFTMVLS